MAQVDTDLNVALAEVEKTLDKDIYSALVDAVRAYGKKESRSGWDEGYEEGFNDGMRG